MDGLTFLQSIPLAGLAAGWVYIVVRLASAAYFNSKHHYEQRKHNHG
jgi:hypothetical protein